MKSPGDWESSIFNGHGKTNNRIKAFPRQGKFLHTTGENDVDYEIASVSTTGRNIPAMQSPITWTKSTKTPNNCDDLQETRKQTYAGWYKESRRNVQKANDIKVYYFWEVNRQARLQTRHSCPKSQWNICFLRCTLSEWQQLSLNARIKAFPHRGWLLRQRVTL